MRPRTMYRVFLALGLAAASMAGSAGADIAIRDNVNASPWSFGSGTTNSYTVSSNAQVLIVTVGQKNSISSGSATYGGRALTKAWNQQSVNAVNRSSTIFYLWNPPSNANTLVVLSGTNAANCYANAFTLSGVDTNIGPFVAGGENTNNLATSVSVTNTTPVYPGSFAVTMEGINTASGNTFSWYATAGGSVSGLSNSLWQVYDSAALTAYGAGCISNLTAGTNVFTGISPGNTGNKTPLAVAVFSPALPRIADGIVTNIAATSADVSATLVTNGNSAATVYLFWSQFDGTNSESAWLASGSVSNLGTFADGAVITNTLTGLEYRHTYYWNYMASNNVGRTWGASNSPSFLTRTFITDATSWRKRMKIRFAGYTQAGTLTNFPVLVVFSNGMASGFNYADFKSPPNQDLRFATADGTELHYEIDTWDSSGVSCVWVQVPAIAGTNDFIWAYWGKSGQSAPAYTADGSTWSNSTFAAVWHMNGPTNAPADSAKQPVDHSVYQGATSNDVVTGAVVGMGHSYNGSGCFVITNNADLANSGYSYTMSFWYFKRSGGGSASSGTGGYGTLFGRTNDVAAGIRHRVGDTNGVPVPDDALRYYNGLAYGWTPALSNGVWHYVEFTKTPATFGGYVQVYLNGAAAGYWTNSIFAFWLTPHCLVGSLTNNLRAIDGILDEVRVSRMVRPANWIWSEWMNMTSNQVFNLYYDVLFSGPRGTTILIN